MIFLRLYFEFFKVGLFSVGGGLATIPFLQELGERTGWFTQADLADMIAVSESTPGPIGVNMSTYVGFTAGLKALGPAGAVLGAVLGVLGLISPSVIIILIVSAFLKRFRDSKVVEGVFSGLRPASTALIVSAALSVALIALFRTDGTSPLPAPVWPAVVIAAGVFVCMRLKALRKVHPIVYIGVAALLGVVLKL